MRKEGLIDASLSNDIFKQVFQTNEYGGWLRGKGKWYTMTKIFPYIERKFTKKEYPLGDHLKGYKAIAFC